MNADNFHDILANPSLLYQVNYQELKSMVLSYPYATHLRYLLYLKSLMDHNREEDANLIMAAMYVPNRKRLREMYLRFKDLQVHSDNLVPTEEYLELKDLETLEELQPLDDEQTNQHAFSLTVEEMFQLSTDQPSNTDDAQAEDLPESLEELRFQKEQPEPAAHRKPSPIITLEDLFNEEQPAEEEQKAEAADAHEDQTLESKHTSSEGAPPLMLHEQPAPTIDRLAHMLESDVNDPIHDVATIVGVIDSLAFEEAPPAKPSKQPSAQADDLPFEPVPHDKFSSWLSQFKPPHVISSPVPETVLSNKPTPEEHDQEEEPHTAPETTTPDQARQLAERSVSEDTGIASETLAKLYEAQGLIDKAIKVYQLLKLKYPEKSAFFAAKIKELESR